MLTAIGGSLADPSPDLANVIDMEAIRGAGVKIGIDPLGGASTRYWQPIIERYGIAAQPSGTEDVYKIYAESFRDESHLHRIQQDAKEAIALLFRNATPASV